MTAVLEHPRWCQDRQHCATRGAHRGRLVVIRTADSGQAPVTAQLVQAVLAGDPYVVISGDEGHVVCSLRQARALCHALHNATRQAGALDTPRRAGHPRRQPGDPGPFEKGRERLTRLLESTPLTELAERHRLLRYDEIVHARVSRNVPVRAELELTDGRRLSLVQPWTTQLLTKESDSVLVRLLGTEPSGRAERPPGRSTAAPGPRRPEGAPAPRAEPTAGGGTGGSGAAGRTRVTSGGGYGGSVVLDGLANIKVDKVPHDLLVLDIGLVLIADPGPFERGRERLVALVRSRSAAELAERHRLIRYDEVVHARITKDIPIQAELDLSDGRRITLRESWTAQDLTDRSRGVLVDALKSVGAEVG